MGFQINKFDSNFIMSRVINTSSESNVSCMHINSQGILGYHQAVKDQLLLVVEGEGWVSGEDRIRISVTKGAAVFWDKGEWHEAGSPVGMTAIVIESDLLEPTKFMPLKHE